MGGQQQSKPIVASEHEKARMRAMRAQEDEYEYIEVGDEKDGRLVTERQAQGLPVSVLETWKTNVLKDPKNRLAVTAMNSLNPKQVFKSPAAEQADQQIFNVRIPFEGAPVTNQRSSGRCWLFASTNVFRVALMKRYRLAEFELSQAYLFYWDKIEKANWFLEQVISTAGEDLDGRLVQHLLGDTVSDGGQWDMVYNLVDKYGLVPQALYPDNWSAQHTGTLNDVVETKLREFALRLRAICRDGAGGAGGAASATAVSSAKAEMMREISGVVTLLLGPPPSPDSSFTWEYVDRDGVARSLRSRPREFARDIASAELRIDSAVIDSMVSLVNDPRHDRPSLLTVDRLGNVVGGRAVTYANVDMATLKAACVAMLRAGLPVFFGCDVGQFSDSSSGVMDLDLYDYELGLAGTGMLRMSKAQRLRTGASAMTHAMVLTAVHVDEDTGQPVRWRVQNSWGPTPGDKGFFVMTDAWMDEFVYQAVVDQRFLTRDVRQVLGQKPTVLPVWDPMGSLA
ncbi:hypothetical protein GMORB2_5381 [Geosmithia morbida]|uniref:Cysteine proteinase 1, mitochondrial n=1 Tax=Geosmithia morbida TaxID=1094350 RepID=A0A9P5D6F8_9HYPO|nr:uncharacterized protein GMORB2_5381 [Geosmithia morbida]KAF4124715.1 hypothetical protein GMORB2_5381 [Geosmithia morbida]